MRVTIHCPRRISPPPNLSFESPDQEVQFIQKECLLIFTAQPLLILLSLIETGFFYLNRALSWEAPSSDQKFVLSPLLNLE